MGKGLEGRFSWGAFILLLLLLAGTGAGYGLAIAGSVSSDSRPYLAAAIGGAVLVAGGFAVTVLGTRRREGPKQLKRVQLVSFVASGAAGGLAFALVAGLGVYFIAFAVLGALLGELISKVGLT
jgi:hypothetical protein